MNKEKLNFDIFIKGNLVDLIILNEEIVESSNWYKWFNDEETTYHMQQHYYPNTLDSQINFFRNNLRLPFRGSEFWIQSLF